MTFRKVFLLLGLIITVVGGLQLSAQTSGRNIAIILDASGSMQAGLDNTTRIAIAREAVITTSSALADDVTNVSLWAYGHRLPQDDPVASCQDIEQILPYSPIDEAQFQETVTNINAIGYTPISDTLQQVASSFPDNDGDNVVLLISDGEETCSGDPCAVASDLVANGIDLVVNTVGFAVDATTRAQLQCIAQVTGGVYYDAQDADSLIESLTSAVVVPTGNVQIVDPDGNPLPDIPFTLINTETNEAVGSFVSSTSVPVGTYTIQINATELITQDIMIIADETTNVVVNPLPIGTIELVDEDDILLDEVRFAVYRLADDGYVGSYFGSARLLEDDYRLEVFTVIPVATEATVVRDETTQVLVDTDAGTIRLVDEATGNLLASPLFEIYTEDGMYLGAQSETYDVPPGNYTVRVRSTIPVEVDVTVVSDEVSDIAIATEVGTLQLVDAETGVVLDDPLFEIYTTDGSYLGAQSGQFDVPPDTYDIRIRGVVPIDMQVVVGSGETVDIPFDTALGTLQLVDGDGNELSDPLFEIYTEDGMYLGGQSGQFDVPPGTYDIVVRSNDTIERFEVSVTVTADTTTQIDAINQTVNP
ncbi:MAG: VWA domain-containing protein [Chloroflexota bacterium]